MKKTFCYSALLLPVLLLSSCGNANSNPPSVEPSVAPSVEASVAPSAAPSVEPSVEPSAEPSAEPSDSASSSASYLGDWTVQKAVGSTSISTEVDESLIGMKVAYTNEKATNGDDEIQNPEYIEQDMTNADFINEYRTPLSAIGIESESVKSISISNWEQAGNKLFIKDDQTMLFIWDGNFYEMKKEK